MSQRDMYSYGKETRRNLCTEVRDIFRKKCMEMHGTHTHITLGS
jgi:hypothetical protein